ncbi:CRTAC1 family protein, partial [bacterium]|nr:CRTAC1 family protein [bacterium]
FEDVTIASGIAHAAYGSGVAIGDYDNDGDPDIYSANTDGDVLFRNRGDGTFEDVTAAAGIDVPGWSCSAGFLDYDGDGFLDLYLTQYVDFDAARKCTDPSGRPEFCGPKTFQPVPDVLLHNEGDGTFRDVSEAAGITTVAGAGLGVVCADLTGDGLVDIYVANDAYANNLWVNQGDGTFLDDALLMGSAFNEQGMAEAGMGVVAADFDDDGDFDLFMTHLKNETHTLYENLGEDFGFEDATTRAGISGGSMPYTGFGTFAFDIELDGDLDLFVANGAVNRGSPLPGSAVGQPWDDYAEPNQIWLSAGGARFDVLDPAEAGDLASDVEVSRGTAVGDLDDDGDLDLVVANCYSPVRIYRNDAPRKGHWLRVLALDPAVGREAIGATVTVRAGTRNAVRSVTRTASYQSSCDVRAHFGLGDAATYDALDVVWPDGTRERFEGGAADRPVTVTRGGGQAQ